MFTHVKISIVTLMFATSSLPARGQTMAFLNEYALLYWMISAMKAERACKGFVVDFFAVARRFDQAKIKFGYSKDIAVDLFDKVHRVEIQDTGLDKWCATKWDWIGPSGDQFKGWLVRAVKP